MTRKTATAPKNAGTNAGMAALKGCSTFGVTCEAIQLFFSGLV